MKGIKERIECNYIEFGAGTEFSHRHTTDEYDSIFLTENDQEYIIELHEKDHIYFTHLPIRNVIYITYEVK